MYVPGIAMCIIPGRIPRRHYAYVFNVPHGKFIDNDNDGRANKLYVTYLSQPKPRILGVSFETQMTILFSIFDPL
jgi:hypothetical protein